MFAIWLIIVLLAFVVGFFLGRWEEVDRRKIQEKENLRLIAKCQFNMEQMIGESVEDFRQRIIDSVSMPPHNRE